MNKQRQILVTVTYNELGCIIDTKAEPYEEPNLQQPCNKLATDTIYRQAAIEAINHICPVDTEYDCTLLDRVDVRCVLSDLPSAQPERKKGKWMLCDNQRREDMLNDNYMYTCTNCLHSDLHSKSVVVPYCWYCGADMRENHRPEYLTQWLGEPYQEGVNK